MLVLSQARGDVWTGAIFGDLRENGRLVALVVGAVLLFLVGDPRRVRPVRVVLLAANAPDVRRGVSLNVVLALALFEARCVLENVVVPGEIGYTRLGIHVVDPGTAN
jgi:hypothetical protein